MKVLTSTCDQMAYFWEKQQLRYHQADGRPSIALSVDETSYSKLWIPSGRDFYPTLIIRQKWHTKVSDVVLIQESNVIRGHWELAQVTKDEPGKDGNVSDVELHYKVQEPGSTYHGQVDSRIHSSFHRIVII